MHIMSRGENVLEHYFTLTARYILHIGKNTIKICYERGSDRIR